MERSGLNQMRRSVLNKMERNGLNKKERNGLTKMENSGNVPAELRIQSFAPHFEILKPMKISGSLKRHSHCKAVISR